RFQPREVMLTLDYSGSMNDDSELKSVGKLGASTVEANIHDMYTELGSPTYGNMTFNTQYISSTNTSTVLSTLGLNGVSYPYPGGSWSDYVNYVKGSITTAYRRDYGYLTWIDYLQNRMASSSQTPDLWKTSEQPITALKNAVAVFLAYMDEVDTDDRIGLAVYNSPSQQGVLEKGLTDDYDTLESISRHRQAGHYDSYTNISAGLKTSREELEDNGRIGSYKLIILMTDGIANRPSNESTAKAAVYSEAQLAADAHIPVVTISLGAGADTDLMQYVADTTGGKHFVVPGDQAPSEYEEDLKEVFRKIAQDMPLEIVQ
ncbi:MAG: VWA domain-containing protein, partial [Planctomycetales bacterium]|nr:VWA domain-containing protein [Planctomycetales bacterium]